MSCNLAAEGYIKYFHVVLEKLVLQILNWLLFLLIVRPILHALYIMHWHIII